MGHYYYGEWESVLSCKHDKINLLKGGWTDVQPEDGQDAWDGRFNVMHTDVLWCCILIMLIRR